MKAGMYLLLGLMLAVLLLVAYWFRTLHEPKPGWLLDRQLAQVD